MCHRLVCVTGFGCFSLGSWSEDQRGEDTKIVFNGGKCKVLHLALHEQIKRNEQQREMFGSGLC